LAAINNELEMAWQVQFAILPGETPKIHGLDIASRYILMSSVAGEFCGFIAVEKRILGF